MQAKRIHLNSAALSSSLTCNQLDIQALIHPGGAEFAMIAYTEAHRPSESSSSMHGHQGQDEIHL